MFLAMTEGAGKYDIGPMGMNVEDAAKDGIHSVVAAYDRDGDGKVDMIEYDVNGDGRVDKVVIDEDGDGVANQIVLDRDFNGQMDFVGIDKDGDGFFETSRRSVE